MKLKKLREESDLMDAR